MSNETWDRVAAAHVPVGLLLAAALVSFGFSWFLHPYLTDTQSFVRTGTPIDRRSIASRLARVRNTTIYVSSSEVIDSAEAVWPATRDSIAMEISVKDWHAPKSSTFTSLVLRGLIGPSLTPVRVRRYYLNPETADLTSLDTENPSVKAALNLLTTFEPRDAPLQHGAVIALDLPSSLPYVRRTGVRRLIGVSIQQPASGFDIEDSNCEPSQARSTADHLKVPFDALMETAAATGARSVSIPFMGVSRGMNADAAVYEILLAAAIRRASAGISLHTIYIGTWAPSSARHAELERALNTGWHGAALAIDPRSSGLTDVGWRLGSLVLLVATLRFWRTWKVPVALVATLFILATGFSTYLAGLANSVSAIVGPGWSTLASAMAAIAVGWFMPNLALFDVKETLKKVTGVGAL